MFTTPIRYIAPPVVESAAPKFGDVVNAADWPTASDTAVAATVTLKGLLVAALSPAELAVSVYPLPVLFSERLLNVAIPFTADAVAVPLSVEPAGFVPMEIVMLFVAVATSAPVASRTPTWTAGVIGAPSTTLDGWTVKASCVATLEPTVALNALLVAEERPLAAATSVYPVPVLLTVRPLNVATPAIAATVAVPPSVAPDAFAPSATVTFVVAVVTMFPAASSIATDTGALIVPPVVTVGCAVNTRRAAVPAVTVNDAVTVCGLLVTPDAADAIGTLAVYVPATSVLTDGVSVSVVGAMVPPMLTASQPVG